MEENRKWRCAWTAVPDSREYELCTGFQPELAQKAERRAGGTLAREYRFRNSRLLKLMLNMSLFSHML